MDEHELETMFRDAPGTPPPAAFSLDDVTKASARATARRRTTLLATAACLVAVLCAAGVAGVSYLRSTGTPEQPAAAPARLPDASPVPTPLQGSGGNGKDGPRAEGTSGCEKVDRELATALAGELPATGTAGPEPGYTCPTGTRSAGFHVTQGDRNGFVSVTVFPAGTKVSFPALTRGAVPAQQRTAGGATLIMVTIPDPGSAAPLGDELPRIANALSARF
jgi:hypothetical protein